MSEKTLGSVNAALTYAEFVHVFLDWCDDVLANVNSDDAGLAKLAHHAYLLTDRKPSRGAARTLKHHAYEAATSEPSAADREPRR